jgi:hypothetical protein
VEIELPGVVVICSFIMCINVEKTQHSAYLRNFGADFIEKECREIFGELFT